MRVYIAAAFLLGMVVGIGGTLSFSRSRVSTLGSKTAVSKVPLPMAPQPPKLHGPAFDAPISEDEPVYFEPGYAVYKTNQMGHRIVLDVIHGGKKLPLEVDLTMQNGWGTAGDYKGVVASCRKQSTGWIPVQWSSPSPLYNWSKP